MSTLVFTRCNLGKCKTLFVSSFKLKLIFIPRALILENLKIPLHRFYHARVCVYFKCLPNSISFSSTRRYTSYAFFRVQGLQLCLSSVGRPIHHRKIRRRSISASSSRRLHGSQGEIIHNTIAYICVAFVFSVSPYGRSSTKRSIEQS